MNLTPKYNIEEYVLYEGKVYKVTSVHVLNWFISIPFVYGLVLAHTKPSEPYAHKELFVREGLLQKASISQIGIWKLFMAAPDNPQRTFYKLFEDLIRNTKIVEYYPYNHTVDFSIGDIVECSYMRGFFRILAAPASYLVIVPIESDSTNSENYAYVGPNFLRKVQVNQEVMRILFHAND